MIFLKEILLSAIFLSAVLLSGCGNYDCNNQAVQAENSENIETDETTTEETTEELREIYQIEPAENVYVYDGAEVLNKTDYAQCNKYVQSLYEDYLINTAVVTVDYLGEKTPEEFAIESYEKLYEGRGSGLLLLINNDTYQDYLYKTGSCIKAITDETEKNEFYYATREIVEDDYKSAVLRLMKLAENCPAHVFDNGSILTEDEVTQFEEYLSGLAYDFSLLVTNNTTETSNEDLCKNYSDRHYKDGKGCMIMIDEKTSTVTVSCKTLPENMEEILKTANEHITEKDYLSAVQTITEEIQKMEGSE